MTEKTSRVYDKFHINLSETGIYPDIYGNNLVYEPSGSSSTFVTHAQASSVVSVPAIPEIQESTYQVPCGVHSIFDPAYKVPAFEKAVYLVVCEHSNWDTGISHALSLRRLADLLNVNSHSQVHRALKWLIDHGWLEVEGKRKTDGTYFYRIIHHKCEPQDVPLDNDGRPQKCAVPTGAGSASQLLSDGIISWSIFVDWTVRKVHSDWTTGIVSMSVRQACKLMGFTSETIKANAEIMMDIGLMERMSKRFRLSVYQLFPKPYPKRRERKPDERFLKKAMKCVNGWYYSLNGLWRFHHETFDIKMKEIGGRWRFSNLDELRGINKHIYRDFKDYMLEISTIRRSFAQA